MAKYKVVKPFHDLQDNNHIYQVGDAFPHKGTVNKERITELSTTKNSLKYALIEEVVEKEAPKSKKAKEGDE